MSYLLEIDLKPDPIDQFREWFAEAVAAGVPQVEAMTLATATSDGRPSARMVLLKGVDNAGFVFFTNYESRKASELAANPRAALVFYWLVVDRQVRIEGHVERVSADESDAYFATRAWGSRIGAWASPQSSVIAGREVLENRAREFAEKYSDEHVPRPPHWGGYRLIPEVIEFWQSQPNRLHDRIRYERRADGSWQRQRLAP